MMASFDLYDYKVQSKTNRIDSKKEMYAGYCKKITLTIPTENSKVLINL